MSIKGLVTDIKKFAVHDGPGIRTTVFLKGCPLSCPWCHNPECVSPDPEVLYYPEKCIACGLCVEICPAHHRMEDGVHVYERAQCDACLDAARTCPSGALTVAGQLMAVEEVLQEVLKDLAFYEQSGGGMTISGGEPMQQPDFTQRLLAAAKEHGLHTCLDTCGYCDFGLLDSAARYTDIFLYDFKESDPILHERSTGASNQIILENLRRLSGRHDRIHLRCPLVPGINESEDHIASAVQLANELAGIKELHLLAYHRIGKSKWDALGRKYSLAGLQSMSNQDAEKWRLFAQERAQIPVIIG
jgi:glycyl-radical enzyme activating protein